MGAALAKRTDTMGGAIGQEVEDSPFQFGHSMGRSPLGGGWANSGLGFDAVEQCALPDCSEEVPRLDEIFGEGFVDDYGGLVGDVAEVTGLSMQLLNDCPVPFLIDELDAHIDGAHGLEDGLAQAIADVQESAFYEGDGSIDCDENALDAVADRWDRIEVSLEILRATNAICIGLQGLEYVKNAEMLAKLVADLMTLNAEQQLLESGKRVEAAAAAVDSAWNDACWSIAKVGGTAVVDLVLPEAIAVSVPALIALTGPVSGPVIAVAAVVGAALVWNAVSEDWGPDIGAVHQTLSEQNASFGVATEIATADAAASGMKAGPAHLGRLSTAVSLALDAAQSVVAVDSLRKVSEAIEATKAEFAEFDAKWNEILKQIRAVLTFANQMHFAGVKVADMIGEKQLQLDGLNSIYGDQLYA